LLFLGVLLLLFPLFLADAWLAALAKLGLSRGASVAAAVGIFAGGLVNVPVRRVPREEIVWLPDFSLFGFDRLGPRFARRRTTATLSVNIGGCVVPCVIVAYELFRIAGFGVKALVATAAAVAINVAICHATARPMPGIGIAMRPLLPAAAAAVCALLFFRELAPPIAFTAGVLGPLVGADLLHLRDLDHAGASDASIGGAGTFDGIVLSGLVATLLA